MEGTHHHDNMKHFRIAAQMHDVVEFSVDVIIDQNINNTMFHFYFTLPHTYGWILVGFFKVFLGLVDFGLDGHIALMPIGRAHFTVNISKFERVNQPQNFIHVTANRQVVDGNLSDDTLWIDQKQAYDDGTMFRVSVSLLTRVLKARKVPRRVTPASSSKTP